MSKASVATVRLRTAGFADHSAIANLMRRYGLETKSQEEWRHLWEYNPEFARVRDLWPMGWLLEDAAEQVVGYFGNIPVAYEFNGKHLRAAATHAWVVDAAYRRSTILLVHRYFSQTGVDFFVDASANYEAGKLFEAMHGRRTPSLRSDIALFWVMDHPRFMASLLKHRGIRGARVLQHVGAGLLWAAGHARRRSGGVEAERARRTADIRFLPQFDDRFDEFWQRLRKGEDALRAVRDCHTLSWHFKYALARGQAWIVVALDGSAICAYAIFLRQDNPAVGLTRARLVDFQALPGSEYNLAAMIAVALARCREEGVHTMESIGFGGVTRSILESHAPHHRRLPAWMFFYKARDKHLDHQLSRPGLWEICSYDGDGSL